jgi:hypothetical protein
VQQSSLEKRVSNDKDDNSLRFDELENLYKELSAKELISINVKREINPELSDRIFKLSERTAKEIQEMRRETKEQNKNGNTRIRKLEKSWNSN